MLTRFRPLVLLVLPIMTLVGVATIRWARGPYWLGSGFDPEYAYLLNALSFAQGSGIHFVDHPGVTVTLLLAAVIRVACVSCGESGLEAHVLESPEFFLHAAHWALLLAYTLGLFWAGYRGARKTGSLTFGLVWQATPLLSMTALVALARVSPEPVLLVISLVLSVLLFEYCSSRVTCSQAKSLAWLIGVVVGVGIATKVTFVPWTLPAIVVLRSWDHRIRFVLGLGLSGLVVVALLGARLEYMMKWFGYLLLASGRYGQGSWTVVRTEAVLPNLLQLVQAEYLFALIVAALCVSWLMAQRSRRPMRLGGALSVGALLQLLLVAKHPAPHYLIPALGTAGLALAVLLGEVKGGQSSSFRKGATAVAAPLCLLFLVLLRAHTLPPLVRDFSRASGEMMRVSERAQTLAETCRLIHYYRSSSSAFALHFGDTWVDRKYSKKLQALYPRYWEYDVFQGRYRDPSSSIVPQETVMSKPCVILHGAPFRGRMAARSPNVRLVDLFGGQHETIYRVANYQ